MSTSENKPSLMSGIKVADYGGPEVLQWRDDLPRPEPGPGQVCVRVTASAINPLDTATRQGQLRWQSGRRRPFVPGNDAAGVVSSVGARVTRWQPGDEVFGFFDASVRPRWHGFSDCGTWAEFAVTSESSLNAKPVELTFEQAAALPIAGLTALQGLDYANVLSGQRLLINGAAGGVGHLATQLAVASGARVTAVAGRQHQHRLQAYGVEQVIDYRALPVADWPTEWDAIYDVANTLPWRVKVGMARSGGRIVDNLVSVRGMMHRLTGGRSWSGHEHRFTFVRPDGSALQGLLTFWEQGELLIEPDRVFALKDVRQACEYQETGHPFGKVVLSHRLQEP